MSPYLRLPAALLVIYLLFVLLVYLGQEKLIFFPRPELHPKESLPAHVVQLQFEGAAGEPRFGWLVNGQYSGDKLLLYYGGNAEDVYLNIDDFRQLEGLATLLVPYAGYNGQPGSPSQQQLLSDAQQILTQVERRFGPRQLFAMGRSLGSSVACFVASQNEMAGLLLVTPFDSLQQVAKEHYPLLPVTLLLKHPFRSNHYVQTVSCPVLVIYGGEDRVVRPERTKALLDQIPGQAQQLFLPGADHNDIHLEPEYWTQIAKFLQSTTAR